MTLLSSASAGQCNPHLRCTNGGSLDRSVCKCYCPNGYHGRRCEVVTDEACKMSGCEAANMACVLSDWYRGIQCTCPTGMCGFGCDRKDAKVQRQCNTDPCQNGGYCSTAMAWKNRKPFCKQKCACKPGFGGRRCEIADPCRTNRCTQPTLYECRESSLHYLGRQCVIRNPSGGVEYVQDDKFEDK